VKRIATLAAVTMAFTLPRFYEVHRCVSTGEGVCACVTCVDSLTTLPLRLHTATIYGVKGGASDSVQLGTWPNVAGKEGLTLIRTVTLPDTTKAWAIYVVVRDSLGRWSRKSNILGVWPGGRREVW
jgi:hypothetical protein